MSVVVKGMQMPPVCVTDDGWYGNCPMDRVWCAMHFKPWYEEGQRIIDEITGKLPGWCPLRPLPNVHGDLIDRDALPSRVEWEDIVNAPAIVGAEGKEPIKITGKIYFVDGHVYIDLDKEDKR